MVFQSLSEKLQNTFAKLRKKGRLTEEDVDLAMREVRVALLEADVNFKVVKEFIKKVKAQAIGEETLKSLAPAHQVIKIVNDELAELMGGKQEGIKVASKPPTVIMMIGLQGAGKTTTAAKLANNYKKQGRRPLLVAADIYRPAAIKQLKVLGEQLQIPVFSLGDKCSPVDIAKGALKHCEDNNNDFMIIDTAGRLHIDEELMGELADIKEAVDPHEILLVIDAMTGQDAVTVAEAFNSELEVTGLVLTKLDGDTRGGAALSVRAVTGCPIKFVGMGEKMDALDVFHADRMASRILGMGDIVSLAEKAQENFDKEQAAVLEQKIRSQTFNLEDFLDQLQQLKKMGPIDQLMGMIPGMGSAKQLKDLQVDDREMARIEAIIRSMTKEERANPDIMNGSRRKRVAAGSGTTVAQVNRLLKQFEQTKKLMRQIGGKDKIKKGGIFKMPF